MKLHHGLLVAALAPLLMAGQCDYDSNQKQTQQQESILMQATNAVGMPAIVNFQERRMLKDVLEKRDQTIATVTYVMDLYGKLHKLCDSVGYGLPYGTEFTSPQYLSFNSSHAIAMPQADPNGLFSPPTAEGTWVNCLNPTTQKTQVVYIEPRVVVSPFPLSTN